MTEAGRGGAERSGSRAEQRRMRGVKSGRYKRRGGAGGGVNSGGGGGRSMIMRCVCLVPFIGLLLITG